MIDKPTISFRATIISRNTPNVSHPDMSSVAMPAVIRGGMSGESQIITGSMSSAQHSQVSNEMHVVHGNRQVCSVLCHHTVRLILKLCFFHLSLYGLHVVKNKT